MSNLKICSVKPTRNYDYLYGLLGRLGSLGLHATIQKEADFSPTWLGPPGLHMYELKEPLWLHDLYHLSSSMIFSAC